MKSEVPKLAGKRLLCHCKLGDACHGDVLIECFIQLHPRAYVVGVTAEPPSEAVALAAARAREECEPDTDTDFDEDAAPPGSGWRGRGEPLWTGRAGKARELQDGAGLCSPGRWRVEDRRYPSSNIWTTISNAVWECAVAWGKPELFEALSRGEVAAIPFASSEVLRLRGYIVDLLKNSGHLSEDQPGDRQHATPRWRLFGAMLAAAQDPDAAGIREFVRGVPIGVGVKLPRLPALYKRKTRWSLEAQWVPEKEEPSTGEVWLANYRSTANFLPQLRKALQADVDGGLIEKLTSTEARRRYGSKLRVGSLGALFKNFDAEGVPVVRVVQDGTRGVDVNSRIRVRDQDVGPLPQDIKRVTRAQADAGSEFSGLIVDVKGAHRLVPVRTEDWGYMACSLNEEDTVYVNKVGTFGFSSAAYWWGRAGGALTRLHHYVVGKRAPLWLLLVADDMYESAAGPYRTPALLTGMIIAAVLDVPLSWHKIKGGSVVHWVGYELLLAEHSVGITVSRASWAVGWCAGLLKKRVVDVSELEEGLGRLSFISGMLDWDRAFLQPLYAFVALEGRGARCPLPPYVQLALSYLVESLPHRRHIHCATRAAPSHEALRVDAHASEGSVGLGGWAPFREADGKLSKFKARWFSVEITPDNAPWAFAKYGQTYRLIASLEALAVLLAVKHLLPQGLANGSEHTVALTRVLTDNRGNGHVLTKLSTSKFPISAVVMELAFTLKSIGLQADVCWVPREANAEADSLSNADTSGFNEELRVHIDLKTEKWHFFDRAISLGESFFADAASRRNEGHVPIQLRRKKRREERLRAKDPW